MVDEIILVVNEKELIEELEEGTENEPKITRHSIMIPTTTSMTIINISIATSMTITTTTTRK